MAAVKSQSATLMASITSAVSELTTLQASLASLKTTLNNLVNSVDIEKAAVSSITTKAELDASTAKLAEFDSQLSGCDVSSVETKITVLELTTNTIDKTSTSDMDTSLTSIESNIDAAIEAAKQAEQEEKDKEAKEKLEAAQKELLETYANLEDQLSKKLKAVNDNATTITTLEAAIKEAQEAIDPVEKKIAAIKESLKSDMLTAEQKTAFESTLETLEKTKATYADNVKTLANQLATIKNANDQLLSELESIDRSIRQNKEAVNSLTVTSDLSEARKASQNVEIQLSAVDVTDVAKELETAAATLATLSLDATVKDLAALEDDVDKAIAGGQEEYEKMQAEKLAKAQEEFAAAIDALEAAIKSEEADYEKCLAAVTNLKTKLAEINEAIAQFKDKYAEIEKNLQALIDKQTRADNSEIIEGLQKKLAELKENIELLESQSAKVAGYIETLEKQAKSYAAVIEEAKTAKQELQNSLSSATTADEVDKLTTSATKAKSELASEGVDWYNVLADNYNTVATYVEGVIDNVNIVDRKTDNLDKEVQETLTGINQLVIDESEVAARYDVKGNRVDSTYKGVQIVRMKNGKTIKINVK